MKNLFYISVILLFCFSCISLYKPITDPRYDLISDYEEVMAIDECDFNFISIVLTKRMFEKKFPEDFNDLESLSILERVVDSLRLDLDRSVFVDSIQFFYEETFVPWKENCKKNWDKLEMTAYGIDSIDILWKKQVKYNDGLKKEYQKELRLTCESDTTIHPTLLNLEIILFDSNGKEINFIKGNEDDFETKQKPIG